MTDVDVCECGVVAERAAVAAPMIEEKFSKAYNEGLAFEEGSYEVWGARDETA